MDPVSGLLVAVAALVAAGGVVAVSAKRPRTAVVGAAVSVAGAAFVADPLPGPAALLAGVTSAVLAAYLGWIALGAHPGHGGPGAPDRGAPTWPGASGIAISAFLAGWLTATAAGRALADVAVGGPSLANVGAGLAAGSPVAQAGLGAAFALVALAAGPVLLARDVLRLGLGLLLLTAAAQLLRASLGAQADDTLAYNFAILYAAGGAGVAALVHRSLAIHGDLELRDPASRTPPVHGRGVDEAHPVGPGR